MAELKYQELTAWGDGYTLRTPGHPTFLGNVVAAFQKNVFRTVGLTALPAYLVAQTGVLQSAHDAAQFKVLGTLEAKPNDAQRREIQSEVDKVIGEDRLRSISDLPFLQAAARNIELWREDDGDTLGEQMDAVFASAIIGMWTAFEVLTGDMWEQVINERPDPLARSAINYQPKADGDSSEAASAGKSPKVKFIESLIGSDLEAANEVGSLLRFARRFDFASLHGIQEAYRSAFGTGIDTVFAGQHGDGLEVLHGVRNALVHAGGRADRAFRRRVKGKPTCYSVFSLDQLGLGSTLPLHGGLVVSLSVAAVEASQALVTYVDKWFGDHPKAAR